MSPLLTPACWAFLFRIGDHPLDPGLGRVWNAHVGGIDLAVTRLKADGIIRDATTAEKVSASHSVKSLKSLLGSRGVPARGKKADLVQAVVECVPSAELAGTLSGVRLFMLTEKGTAMLRERSDQAEAARSTMEDQAYNALLQGDLKQACDLITRYNQEYAFSPWETGEPKGYPFSPRLMLNNAFRELDANAQQRRAFGAAAVLARMLDASPTERALTALGGAFSCPSLEEYMKAPSGYAAKFDPDSVDDMIDLYLQSKEAELVAARDLAAIKKQHLGMGVRISATRGTDCSLCVDGSRGYTWSEIEALPRIPRHWGCKCMYFSWLGSVADG